MYKFFLKRFFDVLLSTLALIVFSVFWIPIIIILLLTGEHEVFYFQKRIGYRNNPFFIWKHATMLKDSVKMEGGLHTTRGDPRVLPFGKFLRKTKINEIPQLINVIKGDMSLIGPRPLVDETFLPYPKHVQERIYDIKPGLAGIGSIVFRDEELLLSSTDMNADKFYAQHIAPYKGELELWYQDHISFTTDLLLVLMTVWVIFFPRNDLLFLLFKDLPKKPAVLTVSA